MPNYMNLYSLYGIRFVFIKFITSFSDSSDMPNFQKLVLTAVDVFLDGSPEEMNTVWHLPHGIISYSKKTPLPLSLIDSLTFHARNHLFQLCLLKLTAMLSVQQTQKLPSPATIGL